MNLFATQPLVNVNKITGIAYGAIAGKSLDPDVYVEICDLVEASTDYDYACGSLAEGEFQFQLKYDDDGIDGTLDGVLFELGGAHLVLVTQSPWTRSVSPCSPCVQNAGDLDSGDVAPSDGVEAYAVPPKWILEEE